MRFKLDYSAKLLVATTGILAAAVVVMRPAHALYGDQHSPMVSCSIC